MEKEIPFKQQIDKVLETRKMSLPLDQGEGRKVLNELQTLFKELPKNERRKTAATVFHYLTVGSGYNQHLSGLREGDVVPQRTRVRSVRKKLFFYPRSKSSK